ncbi:hypothetical protein TCAL_08884 [Tigriopus californicus]|uniref:Uncharacterized protein n=2 Tax=Tigriopus californicus TaxID=6832 RepID=A0A553NT72_TIGCA|nr:hypothetical protein TCAL_08884 [Tigriopus californicus]
MPKRNKSQASSRGTAVLRNIRSYLKETTVHGFRYVADGANIFERLFWVIWITFGFCGSYYMVSQSIKEGRENPILTTIDTASVTTVPFPAVTVDGGSLMNPWGHITKLYNQVEFECYDDPNNCNHTQALRDDFSTVIEGYVARIFAALENSLRDKDGLGNLTDPECLNMVKKGFTRSYNVTAAILAAMDWKSPDSLVEVRKWLVDFTAQTFATYYPRNFRRYGDFGRQIEEKVEAMRQLANITDDEVKICLSSNNMGCWKGLSLGRKYLYPPFAFNRIPYHSLGFGEFLQTSVRRAISTKLSDRVEKGFLMSKNPSSLEKRINGLFIDSLNKIMEKDIGMSSFELSFAVDQRIDESESTYQVPRVMGLLECDQKVYKHIWEEWEGRKPRSSFVPQKAPCANLTEAELLGFEGCCQIKELYDSMSRQVLNVMRYAQQAPHLLSGKKEMEDVQNDALKAFPYPLLPIDNRVARQNLNPRILQCQYNKYPMNQSPEDCQWFARSYTDEGLGYSFNTGSFWDNHQPNQYTKDFYEVMHPDERTNWSTIAYPETSGRDYGLKLTLELNEFLTVAQTVRNQGKSFPVFKVAIHDPATPADLRSAGIEIEPGYLSTFLITPSQTTLFRSAKELDPGQRECRLKTETEGMVIFKTYSQSGCLLECKLAQGIERCGCVPWNYPHSKEDQKICDFEGSSCFERAMADTEQTRNCDCPFDCDSIRYAYSVSSTMLDKDKICKDSSKSIFSMSETSLPTMLERTFNQLVDGADIETEQICRENLDKIAMVQFQLTSKQVTRIKRDRRVTLADMISTFGGTVGLFTGMSILSVIEMIFWLMRLISGSKVDEVEEKGCCYNKKCAQFIKKQGKTPSNLLTEGKHNYLEETTVHGFRYVVTGINAAERFFWILCIALGFSGAFHMVNRSLEEGRNNPIVTTIDTIPITRVPFPAVSIDAVEYLNPWGFITKLYNQVDFECYKNFKNCTHAQAVRKDFRPVIEAVIRSLIRNVQDDLKDCTLVDLERYIYNKQILRKGLHKIYSSSVAILAALKMINPRGFNEAKAEVISLGVDSFAKYNVQKYASHFGKPFHDMLEAKREKYNITQAMVDQCTPGPESNTTCSKSLFTAHLTLYPPIDVHGIPYYRMGFGDFLKEFITPVVVNNVVKGEKEFLGRKYPPKHELELNDLFTQALSLNSDEEMVMSPFEMTYAVSPRIQEFKDDYIQVPRLQAKYDCNEIDYFRTWEAWTRKHKSKHPSTSPPCTNATEAKRNHIQGCCRLREELQSRMSTILKVMSYAIQPPSLFTPINELKQFQAEAEKAFPYPLLDSNSLMAKLNLAPRILECQFNKYPSAEYRWEECNWFGREFNDEGLGYSFNTGPFWDRHSRNEFMDLFYNIMFPDERFNWSTIAHPVSSGRDYGLKLSLRLSDYQGSTDGQRGTSRRINSFKIAVHDPSTPANFRSGGVEIKPGYLSSFLITPVQTVTTKAALALEASQRSCRSKTENHGMKIFKMYSQEACVLECKITYGSTECGCVPWNYPRRPEHKTVCDFQGSTCFEAIMRTTDTVEACDCPLGCDHIRYSISVSSTLLDKDELCGKKPKHTIFGHMDRAPPNKLKRTYLRRVEGDKTDTDQVCRDNVASTAMVQFQITNQQMTRTKRDVRVTLADAISSFAPLPPLITYFVIEGGTVSLFTGMSILSVLEILFWLLRLVSGHRSTTNA